MYPKGRGSGRAAQLPLSSAVWPLGRAAHRAGQPCLTPGCSSRCCSWQDAGLAHVCLFCRDKDGVGHSSQPLWPAEGRVIPALLSRLGLCSLKSSTELGGPGYSSIAGVVATRKSFPAKHLKSITMVQSFVLRHQPSFVLLFQLAVV